MTKDGWNMKKDCMKSSSGICGGRHQGFDAVTITSYSHGKD